MRKQNVKINKVKFVTKSSLNLYYGINMYVVHGDHGLNGIISQ